MRARVFVVGSGGLAGALALAACSYDWTYYGTGSLDAGGSDATLDAEGGGPPFEGGTTQDVAPPPTPVRCNPSTPCGAGSTCVYPDRLCGKGLAGQCVPMGACPGPAPGGALACACDGATFSSPCEAQTKGLDVAADGRCKPGSGAMICGYWLCATATTYCQVTKALDGGAPEYACMPWGGCAAHDCTCLTKCSSCTKDGDGGFTEFCP